MTAQTIQLLRSYNDIEVPRLVVYARSATGKGNVLAVQLGQCRHWARAHGCAIVGEYMEVGSGCAVSLPERARAIAQAEIDDAVLMCSDPSRLARDRDIFDSIVTACKRRGVAVMFINAGG